MKCPQLSTRQAVILGILLTITFIQLFGGYKISYVSRAWSLNTESIRALDNTDSTLQLLYLNGSEFSSSSEIYSNESCPTVAGERKTAQANPHMISPIVHIAMVFSGHTGSLSIYLAIKSILMHRSTKLHFHFVTDSRNIIVLQAMLNSWLVPGITHDYYAIGQASEIIRKSFTDSLTANCFGTLSIKLNLHLILPDSVKHVLVIEPTSVVNADLFKLWSMTVSCADQMITLCSEKCVSYCHRGTTVLHNNTREDVLLHGAMGLNLDRIRSPLPKQCWSEAVVSVYLCRPNAIETVYNASNNLDNSPNHEPTDVCKTVQEYDGNLLRYKEVKQCKDLKPLVQPHPNKNNFCKVFSWERVTRRRELPFLLEHSYSSSDEYDVTMSTHLDYNRMSMIEQVLTNWGGPVSIAIHVTESQVLGVIDFIMNSTILRERKNISYHLMFNIGPSYPPNAMRALAHRHVATPYVFFNDIDYVTSYQLYTAMKQYLKQLGNIHKIAIVIPAFETKKIDFEIPRNKSKMLECISQKQVEQFHKLYFAEGHRPTNYPKWIKATEPYYIKFKDMYEPYCLLKTSVFSFDPRFVARFHNKGSHSTQLHMAGYKFLVLPDCFIIHLPHKKNKQNMQDLRKCSRQWYKDWVKEKRKQYNYKKKDILSVFIA